MANEIIMIILLTLVPALELRASIPFGILAGQHWFLVFVIAVITNIILAPVVWFLLDYVLHFFIHIKSVNNIWNKYKEYTQEKIHKYIDRWGILGLAIFIGIPLPGSGVYSGTIGAYALGMHFKDYMKAAVIGVLISGAIVTAIMLTGTTTFSLFVK